MDRAGAHIVAAMPGQVIAILGHITVDGVNGLDLKSIGHLNGHILGGRIVEAMIDTEALVFRASQDALPTGSIAIADVEDNTVICGGWGANIGDMGSGYQLGLEAIQQVLKEVDCSDHFSLLSKAILKEESPPKLISASEYCKYRDSIREKLSPFDRSHIAEYAKVVYKCAEEGDETSLSLYKKVGEDLADIVLSAIAKIGENSVGVVVSGGMVNAKEFWKNHFENRLSSHTDLKNISYLTNGIDQALSEIAKRVIER